MMLEMRLRLGLTQAAAAERLGLSLRAYQRAELHGPTRLAYVLAMRWLLHEDESKLSS